MDAHLDTHIFALLTRLTLNFCDKNLKSSDKFLTNASGLGFINHMLAIKSIFLLTAEAMYFSNLFDIFTLDLPIPCIFK